MSDLTTVETVFGIVTLIAIVLFFIYLGYWCGQGEGKLAALLFAGAISCMSFGCMLGVLMK